MSNDRPCDTDEKKAMAYGIIDIVSLRQEQNPVYPTLPSVSHSSGKITLQTLRWKSLGHGADTLTDISGRNGGKEGLRVRS